MNNFNDIMKEKFEEAKKGAVPKNLMKIDIAEKIVLTKNDIIKANNSFSSKSNIQFIGANDKNVFFILYFNVNDVPKEKYEKIDWKKYNFILIYNDQFKDSINITFKKPLIKK